MRRPSHLGAFVVAGGALLPFIAQGEDEAPREAIAKGHAIAEEKCARCHAIGLEGASAHERAPPFRAVVRRYPIENLAEALAEGIISDHPDMPVFTFGPAEIEAFLAYLDHLRQAGDRSGEGK
jgi:mono/diheme cytochrome c family protein